MKSLFVVATAIITLTFLSTRVSAEKDKKMSSAMSKLTKMVKENPVIVFSKTYCPYHIHPLISQFN